MYLIKQINTLFLAMLLWSVVAPSLHAGIVFEGSPGTNAPPPTLGGFLMTNPNLDARPLATTVSDVGFPLPNNPAISFSNPLIHYQIGSGWSTWSHGYTGDVYFNNSNTVTITLPVGTRAYYLYIEGNSFTTANITATANDGTTSGAIPVNGFAGANYYGFYTTSAACMLTTITITADPNASGFAIGEFGLNVCQSSLTCPASQTIALGPGSCDTSLFWAPIASSTCADTFVGINRGTPLDADNWTTSPSQTGFTFYIPDSIRVEGNSASGNRDLCLPFDCAGRISFTIRAYRTGASPFGFNGDHVYIGINGVFTQFTPNTNGSTLFINNFSTNVQVGDVVCVRVSSNGVGARTVATLSAITYSNLLLTQTTGPLPATAPGLNNGTFLNPGTHLVTYTLSDCYNNNRQCSFNITVTDAAPTITCPSNTTIYLDSMDCSRVYCYNVTATDNCVQTSLNIPGMQYIGVYNGNTYYISQPGLANHLHWIEANEIATALGGHLATIGDVAENTFLMNNIPFTLGIADNEYWLGLRYSPSLDQYKWITGEPVNYTNWGPGQPGIIPGDFVWYWDPVAGTWYDSPSLLFRRYIIEFEGGLQIKRLAGIPSGNPYPPGVTTNVYQAMDEYGNMAQCSFTVNVLGSSSLSCKNVNVSLDQNCEVTITPEMLLTGPYNCYDVFEVTLSHYNHPIPNPVDSHYLGKTIIATVTDPTTGNSCWSYVTIEDKLAPEIICRDQDMSCIQFNLNAANPAVIEDCSRYTVTLLDELTTKLDCNPEYIKEVRRTWISTDTYGNISDTCVQLIRVERPDINLIDFPDQIVDLECSRISRFDANGNPHPSITGIPTLEGYQIWPNIDFICNMYVDYEDQDLGDIGCVHKIMRTWRAREWWCNQEFTVLGIQFIQIKDTEGPIITHRPYDFDATTGHRDCEADVLLPAIDAYDRCHDKLRVDISYPGGSLIGKNGGKVILPVGRDTVIYRIYDGCYNVTTDTLIVTVKDDTEPVAICDRRTVVALNDAGINWVPAEVFDDGSFDECHLHHFEVRRMDADACGIVGEDDWGPEVGFCCEDVGRTIMVAFKAIDASGNESVCMVSVEVQDKDVPLISCPPDILVDCRFDIDLNNLGTSFGKVVDNEADREKIVIDPIYWHIINGHPQDGIAYDNCSPRVSERIDTSGMNQCGMGLIIREFTVTDGQGNSASCVQSIEIQNHHPMTYLSITWPADLDTNGICNPDLLIPERLSAPYNFPTYVDDECSLIGLSYHDHVFSQTVPGDPCFKIFRVWKLIDWCQRDRLGNIVIFSDTQIIKVSNLIDPIITKLCRDTTICSYDVQCRPIPISLSIDAIDDCTDVSELLYRYKVDLNSDGTIDIERATIGDNTASGTWPLGRHIIKWEVEDRCGNTAKCQSVVNLLNCKSPTAYCHRDLSIGLTGMDTDGNGTPDTKMAVVWASDLNVNSGHSCGYPVTFSFSADTNDKSRTYTCDSIGPRNVELWVTDINGNTSVCKTVIIIWDNPQSEPQCPQTLNVRVNGQIKTEGGSKVEKVGVLLEQSTMPATSTNFEGEYAFGPIATGGSYAVKPGKNDDWLNGISTADIVKIQKHILGTEPITSPYKMVAADVNKSKTVTARDIADLRKLILGLTQEISGNTSWRFVDEYYSFGSVEGALTENFPEVYNIPTMSSNTVGNFIGIKVGDVNESAKTRGYQNTTSRSGKVMDLSYRDEEMKKGNVYEIEFNSSNIDQFRGFQMTMEWNAEMMEVMEVTGNRGNHFGEEHYSMHKANEGKITFSWDGSSKSGERLFTVKVRAKADARVSDMMHIGSSITPALSIGEGLEEGRIELRSQGKLQNEFVLLQNEPNPWNGTTVIGMLLPEKGEVKLTIYDMTGKVYFRSAKEL
ncbi:MAG: lectin-like protein, partial [Saprospiraceae bacterium]